jgi:hypothetical protein
MEEEEYASTDRQRDRFRECIFRECGKCFPGCKTGSETEMQK